MKPEDNSHKERGKDTPAGRGRGSGVLPEARPPSLGAKILTVIAIVAIFVVAGLLVIFTRACGGDEPAPLSGGTAIAAAETGDY